MFFCFFFFLRGFEREDELGGWGGGRGEASSLSLSPQPFFSSCSRSSPLVPARSLLACSAPRVPVSLSPVSRLRFTPIRAAVPWFRRAPAGHGGRGTSSVRSGRRERTTLPSAPRRSPPLPTAPRRSAYRREAVGKRRGCPGAAAAGSRQRGSPVPAEDGSSADAAGGRGGRRRGTR